MALFGYMVVLIIIKWLTKYEDAGSAPLILNIMINMFMLKLDPGDILFPGQKYVQFGLLGIALLSVPIMLVPKPLCLYFDRRRGFQQLHEHAHHDHDGHDHHAHAASVNLNGRDIEKV